MPRSGSTLLGCILNQNPKFRASMTSPVAQIIKGCLKDLSNFNEASVFLSDEQKENILHGVFKGYYGDLENKIIFDTSRYWACQAHLIKKLYPDAKIICCIRNLAWICDSFERLVRKYPLEISKLHGFNPDFTVYDRVDALTKADGTIGFAFNAFKQAIHSDEQDRVFVIEYENLVRSPELVIRSVYEALNEPYFDHNYENITYDPLFDEFDRRLGVKGLHSVQKQVNYAVRETILPPDLFNRLTKESFWSNNV